MQVLLTAHGPSFSSACGIVPGKHCARILELLHLLKQAVPRTKLIALPRKQPLGDTFRLLSIHPETRDHSQRYLEDLNAQQGNCFARAKHVCKALSSRNNICGAEISNARQYAQGLFKGVIGADAMGEHCKPDLPAFAHAVQIAAAQPERCLMVEDSLKNLRTARTLGMTTMLVLGQTAHEEGSSR